MTEGLQKRLQVEVEKFKVIQKDYQKSVSVHQQLEGQLHENTMVKDEMDLLEPTANVFKLMGPVLVKQDLEEAKQTVQKRIDYISTEMKRHEHAIKEADKKQESTRESLNKIQQQLQQKQVKAAARA